MIIHFFRIGLFVMLAALSAQAMAFSDAKKSDSHSATHCTMVAMADMIDKENVKQVNHHGSNNPSLMAEHMASGDAEHAGCCDQDCSCPASLCGHAFLIEGQSLQTISPDTRKHVSGLPLMFSSLISGALFRPPIIA